MAYNDTTPLVLSVNHGSDDHNGAGTDYKSTSGRPKDRSLSPKNFVLSPENGAEISRIGMLGSIAIAVNSLAGPAMLILPQTFQTAGFIPTTLTLIFVAILSAFCCLHMANTISKVPGNSNYEKEIDYSEAFKRFWGQKSFLATQVLFFFCVTCLNISSIVDTSQVVDTIFGHLLQGGSAALHLSWDNNNITNVGIVRWTYSQCSARALRHDKCIPFNHIHKGLYITLGYFISSLIFIPMALMDLKENANAQIVGFVVLLLSSVSFMILFLSDGIHTEYISMWGESWTSLFGVILFDYALVLAIPSWLHEKQSNVNARTVITGSSILSTILYIIIGCFGAMVMRNVPPNMLESMMSGTFGSSMQVCASVFAFFIIGLDCPLYSVLTRMNLTSAAGGGSRLFANCLAVYLPYTISWLFYGGNAITELLSWGGMLFTSLVVFILPLLLSLHTVNIYPDMIGSIPVYGKKKLNDLIISSKQSQRKVLILLLFLASFASLAALLGNIYKTESKSNIE